MKEKKDFDAVEMMRKLRRAVDDQLAGKSYEEQRRYLDKQVPLRQKAAERQAPRKAV